MIKLFGINDLKKLTQPREEQSQPTESTVKIQLKQINLIDISTRQDHRELSSKGGSRCTLAKKKAAQARELKKKKAREKETDRLYTNSEKISVMNHIVIVQARGETIHLETLFKSINDIHKLEKEGFDEIIEDLEAEGHILPILDKPGHIQTTSSIS